MRKACIIDEMTPDASWFKANGYVLDAEETGGRGQVWSNAQTGEWAMVSKTNMYTTVFFPASGDVRQFPHEPEARKGFEWSRNGVDKALRAACSQLLHWSTSVQVAETSDSEKDAWEVTLHKADETCTTYIPKTAVINGDVAFIADQLAKSLAPI